MKKGLTVRLDHTINGWTADRFEGGNHIAADTYTTKKKMHARGSGLDLND